MDAIERAQRPDGPCRRVAEPPDPEVSPPRVRRRRFSPEYKQAILAEYERCREDGQKGALLRREELYSSHIVAWRRAREEGGLAALNRPRGRPPAQQQELELQRLRVRNARLEGELAKARLVIEVQGKVSALLGKVSEQRTATGRQQVEQVVDAAVAKLVAAGVAVTRACEALGRSRATHYRRQQARRQQVSAH